MRAKKAALLIMAVVSLATALFVVLGNEFGLMEAEAAGSGTTLYVGGSGPGNYSSIQTAIDAASEGDTVYVYSGTYYENVVISKSIDLIGKDEDTTIIDGGGSGDVIHVTADDVTISGFTVQNSGSSWPNAGIKLDSVQHCRIENTTASNNNHFGIELYSSSNCTITNTTASNNNLAGITLWHSSNCTITNTTASNNYGGIGLLSSSNCTITNTTLVDDGIVIGEYSLDHWNTHTIDTSNTVNGKPVYYWKNVNGGTVPAGAGQIILANCTNVMVENQNVSNTDVGIELGFSKGCTITNTTASNNNLYGIYLSSSSTCTITHTTASNNNLAGITLWHSSTCTITHTTVSSNNHDGIYLEYSSTCTIRHSNIYGNVNHGVYNYNSEPEYTVDAAYNWWGSADGPSGVGPGNGDSVSSNVVYEPWLTEPYEDDNSPSGDIIPVSEGTSVTVYERTGSLWAHTFTISTLTGDGGTFSTGAGEYYTVSSDGYYLTIECSRSSTIGVGNNIAAVKLNGVPGYPDGVWATFVHNFTLGEAGDGDSVDNALGNNMTTHTNLGNIYSSLTLGFSILSDISPDIYEPDDIPSESTLINVDGVSQTHNFHREGDVDWLMFNAVAGSTYVIETSNLGSNCDTYLYLYDTDGSTEITHDDDGGEGYASKIEWNCTASGTYYVKIRHYDSETYGSLTSYDVSLSIQKTEPDAVYIEPLFSIEPIETGGEYFLYLWVTDEEYQPVDGVELVLSPTPTGSETNCISHQGLAVASYDFMDAPSGDYSITISECRYNENPIPFDASINPIVVSVEERTCTTTVGTSAHLGGELKGVHVEGGIDSDYSLTGNQNDVTQIAVNTEAHIGAGVESTLGIEVGDVKVSPGSFKTVMGLFMGGHAVFQHFSESEENEIATLLTTRVTLNAMLATPGLQLLHPVITAAMIAIDLDLITYLSPSSYAEGGIYASILGNINLDEEKLGFRQDTDDGEKDVLVNLSEFSFYADLGIEAKGSLALYQDGKVGVNTWVYPYIEGEHHTYLGNGAIENRVHITVDRLYTNFTTLMDDFFHPEKVTVKLGGKAIKENIDTSELKEGLYNLYAPLQSVLKDITHSTEITYLIEYECDLTNPSVAQYPELIADAKGIDGYSFGFLETLAHAMTEGFTPRYTVSVFDKTDYGLDIDLGAIIAGFELNAHLLHNVQHKTAEGYVLQGHYYPVVDYETTAPAIDMLTYIIEHFDASILLSKIGGIGVTFNCPVNITITNESGYILGYNNSGFVNEIDGAYYYLGANDTFSYYLPEGNYSILIRGEDTGSYDGQYIIYGNNTIKTVTLANVSINNASEDPFTIQGDRFGIGSQEDKKYDLKIESMTNDSKETFRLTDMPIYEGEHHWYTVTNWDDLSGTHNSSVSLAVDEDSDGVPEYETNLTNNMSGDDVTPKYSLTIAVDPAEGGYVTRDPSNETYPKNTVVNLTAYAHAGYEFSHWSGDTSGINASINITIDENKSITAHFSEIPTQQYTLSSSVSPSVSGSITLSPAGGTYDEGTVVTATATATSGYEFDHWGGDASGTSTSVTITMTGDKSITAYFTTEPPENEFPTISLNSPVDGSTVSGTVTISGTASDSDGTVESVQVQVDADSWQMATGTTSWTYSWDTTTVDNGNHTVKARSYDGEDYSDVAMVNVEVFNNHPPSVSITSPENRATVNGTVVVNGTVSDEDGGEQALNDTLNNRVEVRIGDGNWMTALEDWMHVSNTTITAWTYTWNTTEIEDGDYTVDVRAYDGIDYSDIESITVTVDNKEDGGDTAGFQFVLLLAAAGLAVFVFRRRRL